MPGMNGYEVCQKIRAQEKQDKHVPIIANTAFMLCDVKKPCLEAGMDAVTNKPISQQELHSILQHLINP